MKPGLRIALLLAFILPAVGCDQATKELARTHLAGRPSIEALGGSLLLTYTENPGVALSLGEGIREPYRRGLITFGTAFVLVLVFAFALLRRGLSRGELVACGLLLGGGLGNLVDRFFNEGRVVDFAVMSLGPLQTGVFNAADVLIVVGVVMLLVLVNRQDPAEAL